MACRRYDTIHVLTLLLRIHTHVRLHRGRKAGKAPQVRNRKLAPRKAYDKVWERVRNEDGEINERLYTILWHA